MVYAFVARVPLEAPVFTCGFRNTIPKSLTCGPSVTIVLLRVCAEHLHMGALVTTASSRRSSEKTKSQPANAKMSEDDLIEAGGLVSLDPPIYKCIDDDCYKAATFLLGYTGVCQQHAVVIACNVLWRKKHNAGNSFMVKRICPVCRERGYGIDYPQGFLCRNCITQEILGETKKPATKSA